MWWWGGWGVAVEVVSMAVLSGCWYWRSSTSSIDGGSPRLGPVGGRSMKTPS